MNKKAIYSILSTIVAMVVLSVSLVFAIGPKVSADIDEEEMVGVLDNAEYFHFADEEQTIIDGLSWEGNQYANNYIFGSLRVVIPNGVTEIRGVVGFNNWQSGSVFTTWNVFGRPDEDDDGSGWTDFHANKVIEVTLPESLTTICDYAFSGCSQLRRIVIPANVTEIGEYVFENCSNLYYSLAIILENDDLFDHPNLAEYNWQLKHNYGGALDKEEYFDIDENGCLNGLTDAGYDYACHYTELDVIVPEGVKKIEGRMVRPNMASAFGYNEEIISVKLPSTLEEIGWLAFNCNFFESIVIPASVTSIDSSTFSRCSNLIIIYCECPKAYADEYWNISWKDGCDAKVVWDCNKTITFNVDSGSDVASQTVCVDSLVVEPTAPTKDGYEFKGWLLNGEPYDFATPVTEDMTLTAKWEEVQVQPEPTEPETPAEENLEVNNQNNTGLIWGIAGTAAGILIIGGIVFGIVIAKRRHK